MDRQRDNRDISSQVQLPEQRAAGRRFLGWWILGWLAVGAAVSVWPEPLGTAIPLAFLLMVPGVV